MCVFAPPRSLGVHRVSLFHHLTVSCTRYEFTTISSIAIHDVDLLHSTLFGPERRRALFFILLESPILNVKYNFWKCTYCHRKYGRIEKHETIRSRIIIEHHTDRIQSMFVCLSLSYPHTHTHAELSRVLYIIITFGWMVGVAKTAKNYGISSNILHTRKK